ncbi:MAG: hypothetical protein JWO20_1686 [Candidatus Angelobacter sp.]|nr:hypothetical protein [Candidatus Angelobacter sp.]
MRIAYVKSLQKDPKVCSSAMKLQRKVQLLRTSFGYTLQVFFLSDSPISI